MSPETVTFLREFGLPITLLLLAIITGARGDWEWGRSARATRLEVERERAEWRQRLADNEAHWQAIVEDERARSRKFEGLFMNVLTETHRVAAATEQLAARVL